MSCEKHFDVLKVTVINASFAVTPLTFVKNYFTFFSNKIPELFLLLLEYFFAVF